MIRATRRKRDKNAVHFRAVLLVSTIEVLCTPAASADGFQAGQLMRILIIYFSFTGNVETLARRLHERLSDSHQIEMERIQPKRSHRYPGWLLRSFIPGWRVSIEPSVRQIGDYDLICLGFPKWTMACPPLNEYLHQAETFSPSNFALFMAYGGFDEDRYLGAVVSRLQRQGHRVIAQVKVKRRQVQENQFQTALDFFCARIWEGVLPTN